LSYIYNVARYIFVKEIAPKPRHLGQRKENNLSKNFVGSRFGGVLKLVSAKTI